MQLFSGYNGENCPTVLCKMRAAIVAPCQMYSVVKHILMQISADCCCSCSTSMLNI